MTEKKKLMSGREKVEKEIVKVKNTYSGNINTRMQNFTRGFFTDV